MKKILFGVAALGLLGLAGAGIGLKAQDTVEAKAAAGDYTDFYLKGDFNDWADEEKYQFIYDQDGNYVLNNVSLSTGDFKIANADYSAQYNVKSGVFGSALGNFTDPWNKDDNINCRTAGTYDFLVNPGNGHIYVSFSTPVATSYFYVSTNKGVSVLLHMWNQVGGDSHNHTAWASNPDLVEATSATVSSQLNFNGKGTVIAVPVSALWDNFILHYFGGGQTDNLKANEVAGKYFYYENDAWHTSDAGADLTKEAILAYDVDAALKNNTSLCDLSDSVTGPLLSRYSALSQKTEIDSSTIHTFNNAYKRTELPVGDGRYADVPLSAIFEEMGYTGGAANRMEAVGVQKNYNYVILGLVVAGLGLMSAMFLVRHKKEN